MTIYDVFTIIFLCKLHVCFHYLILLNEKNFHRNIHFIETHFLNINNSSKRKTAEEFKIYNNHVRCSHN